MRVVVITPPEPIVTFDEAAQQLRLGSDQSQKTYVEGLIAAATAHIDGPKGWLGCSFGVQTLEARFEATTYWRAARLPYGPVIDLQSVEYLDMAEQTITAQVSDFDLIGSELLPAAEDFPWVHGSPRREAVRVRYRAGYEDGVPTTVKAAILLMVGDLYRNRGEALINQTTATVAMSTTVENLLAPFRNFD